jgi:hypothetical protein
LVKISDINPETRKSPITMTSVLYLLNKNLIFVIKWPNDHAASKTSNHSFGELNGSCIFELKYNVIKEEPNTNAHCAEKFGLTFLLFFLATINLTNKYGPES